MSLLEAAAEKGLIVFDILSGIESKRKLNIMGIHKNDTLVKLNNTRWGPVLVKNLSNGSTKVALGRNLADKIIVNYEK